MIKKIKFQNYKIFENNEMELNPGRNIFVGENGVGKSSILQAITLVLSGSINKIEHIGFQTLFNTKVVEEYMNSDKVLNKLPELIVELYFSDDTDSKNFNLNGKQNTDKIVAFGLQLKISANIDDYSEEIKEALEAENGIFPFDYYKPEFNTFSGNRYDSYHKFHKLKYEFIDSTEINQNFATRNFISRIFSNNTDIKTRQKISHKYHEVSEKFSNDMYEDWGLNSDESGYQLKLKSPTEAHFVNQITAHKENIEIENLGNGERVLLGVKTSLASAQDNIQIVLLEEPENHLSFLNMHKLVEMIDRDNTKQTFIATHSNMIASRLGLQNVTLVGENSKSLPLTKLKDNNTARFFEKSPNTNALNFILAKNVILVEGDAEYILMEHFYKMITSHKPFKDDVTIISCNGKTFERYLQIAQVLNKKVAVITDNDKNYKQNIESKYSSYDKFSNINIFSDRELSNYTFEVCLYSANENFYEETFKNGHMTKGVLEFMLKEKAEAAFRLLEKYPINFQIPEYIKGAIEWIRPQKT